MSLPVQPMFTRRITVTLTNDGFGVNYTYFSFEPPEPPPRELFNVPTCDLHCNNPTTFVFALDDATIEAGWTFVGTVAKPTQTPSPGNKNLLPSLGFSTSHPNTTMTVFAPYNTHGNKHRFTIYYANPDMNNGQPIGHDPEETNVPG